ncbi:MAG: glutathione S-transferase family protein [Rhodospirillales bacterium]
MGMLIDGQWSDEDSAPPPQSAGAFVRVESAFRDRVTADGASGFKAEPGRYHLLVAPSCPWAHRTFLVRAVKKLENAVSIAYADRPKLQGWAFSQAVDDRLQPTEGVLYLHRVYAEAKPGYTGKVTVPTLWDRKTRTIVNNESSEIIRMFNTEFNAWGDAAIDLYPADLRAEIDAINAYVYERVNNGVYRCGFAKTQEAYAAAFNKLFEGLDALEERLSRSRYLCGDRITEADWRLFPTLVRFDPVYHGHFKCNRQRLADYHNLINYTRELYQVPGVAATVDVQAIKDGYYRWMPHVNPSGVVPLGPAIDYGLPHDRERLKKAA